MKKNDCRSRSLNGDTRGESSFDNPDGKSEKEGSRCPCSASGREGMTRLGFISWLGVGWITFAASIAVFFAMIIRFFAPNVIYEPSLSFRVGFLDEYAPGEVSIRWKSRYGIWIVHLGDRIVALSTICTHLGCTPNWLANDDKFKCPCHGSGFRETGMNFEGPAPRPLERFKIFLDDEGMLVVDKTTSFRQEQGEWDDPDSFVAV